MTRGFSVVGIVLAYGIISAYFQAIGISRLIFMDTWLRDIESQLQSNESRINEYIEDSKQRLNEDISQLKQMILFTLRQQPTFSSHLFPCKHTHSILSSMFFFQFCSHFVFCISKRVVLCII